MASVISQNYAEALFMLAKEQDAVMQFKEALFHVNEVFKIKDVRACFDHPNVLKSQKKELLKTLVDAPKLVLNFLMVLIDKSRISLLEDIIKGYNHMANESLGIKEVSVTSASELNDEELVAIKKLLKSKLNQEIELECYVDVSLMAGIKLEVDGIVFDNTALSKLERIKEKVDSVTLKIEV